MSYPFILTIIAGLSTLIGLFPIFLNLKNEKNIISASCSFAAGVMLSISIMDLIPEAFKQFNKFKEHNVILLTLLFLFIGIALSYLIDKYLDKIENKSSLFKVGILSMIVIILHNIPEGIVTYIVSKRNILLGISICIAVSLHNIPEGITISVPIYYGSRSRKKAIIYTLISAISEPFGAFLSYLFLSKYINDTILGMLFSITSGIMIQISLNKLIPLSKINNNKLTSIFFLLGALIMIISLYIN